MRKRIAGAITCLLVAVVASWSFAQSSEMEEATVAFDLQVGKMRNGELMKLLDLEKELSGMQQSGQIPDEVDLTKVERIFGAMSLPDDVATFQEMSQPEGKIALPFDMFIRMKFADKATTDKVFDSMVEKAEPVDLDGRKFYAPTEEDSPTNVVMHRADDTTVEMGTKSYLVQEKRKELFSKGLGAAWAKVPDHAFRIAVDLKGESELLAEAVEMGKASAPDAMTKAYLDLIDNASDMRFSIDLDADNLVVLGATGVDDDQAEELRSGLDAIMGIAKMGGQQGLAMIPDPNAAKIAGEILESLKATAEGTSVLIAVPKPEGFNSAVKQMVDQFKQMQEMMQQGAAEGDSNDDDDDGDDDGDDGDDG